MCWESADTDRVCGLAAWAASTLPASGGSATHSKPSGASALNEPAAYEPCTVIANFPAYQPGSTSLPDWVSVALSRPRRRPSRAIRLGTSSSASPTLMVASLPVPSKNVAAEAEAAGS